MLNHNKKFEIFFIKIDYPRIILRDYDTVYLELKKWVTWDPPSSRCNTELYMTAKSASRSVDYCVDLSSTETFCVCHWPFISIKTNFQLLISLEELSNFYAAFNLENLTLLDLHNCRYAARHAS